MPPAARPPLTARPIATEFKDTTRRRVLRAAVVSLLLVGVFVSAASPAHAWTRAQVRGAEADLTVVEGDLAQLRLAVRIHIGGGWLSELELPGIPQDAEFDATKPATLIADTGETYPPTLVLRHGVWSVTFPGRRHEAPWRGDYTLTLNYRSHLTSLGHPNEKTQRLQWAMPSWRSGIEAAKIRVDAPSGTVSADHIETGIAYSVSSEARADRVAITHERTQLPRDTGWVVTFDIPRLTPGHRTDARTAALAPERAPSDSKPTPQPTWWPLGVLGLALLKRWLVANLARKRRVSARLLIPGLGPGTRTAVICSLGLLAVLVAVDYPLLAAAVAGASVALSLVRSFEPPVQAALHWSTADDGRIRPTFWLLLRASVAPHAWLDATTPIGVLTLGGLASGLWWIGRTGGLDATSLVLVASLTSPLWCTATRLHLPWEGEAMARVLNAWRLHHGRTLSDLLVATPTLLVGRDEEGIARDARMPLRQASADDGIQSLDLVVVTDARTLKRQVALLAQVAAGSAADARLAEIPVSSRRRLNTTVVHIIGADHIFAALAPREVHQEHARATVSEPGLEAA